MQEERPAPKHTFRAGHPPRVVSRDVKLRNWFGGITNMLGWIFFGFGMIFVWIFVPLADFSFITFSGSLETTQGELVYSGSTNVSVNEQNVKEYRYRYVVNGDTFQGVSYSQNHGPIPASKELEIEYKSEKPFVSRVKGMSQKQMPVFVLFVLLFPLIGLGFIVVGYGKGIKAVSLLKIGKPAFGKLIKKEPTGTKINDQTVYRYHFEFEDEFGKTHQMVSKTHVIPILEDDDLEELLYDPDRPEFAVTLDDLSGRPVVSQNGVVMFSRPGEGSLSILPAIASIIVHGAIALFYFYYMF